LTLTVGGRPTVRRYWRLKFGARGAQVREADAAEELRALLDESVKLRSVADVPLGAFLSGGIDSSTVVALLSRHAPRGLKTFSIDFPSGDGEARWARLVAARYGTEHHELQVTPDMVAVLPQLVRRYGEPFADSSAVAVHYLSQLARTQVTVALSGDGADEAFGGYHRYRLERLARACAALPGATRLLSATVARLPGAALEPLRGFLRHLDACVARRYLFLFHFMEHDRRALLGPALLERGDEDPAAAELARRLEDSTTDDPINQLLELDFACYLADDILPKVDIASMTHALEVRAPFLDHKLLEAAARLPGRLKVRVTGGKHVLRRAVAGLLPRRVRWRMKKGFGLPLGRWLRHDLAAFSRALLTDGAFARRGLVQPAAVTRLLDEQARGVDHSVRLWNLLVLELWYRQFIDA
jgi:asparagine synthase (glutamine-hydrolysing)